MLVYDTKNDAFPDLKRRFPRGADVGTQFSYGIPQPNSTVMREVAFTVVAVQVWDNGSVSRPMGLVWSGCCDACTTPFYQVTETHPDSLRELCSFCASSSHETHDFADPKIFGRQQGRLNVKRRGRVESHVVETLALFADKDVIEAEELISKAVETLPPPKEGERDIRRQTVIRAINSLSREQSGPLFAAGEKVVICA